LLDTNRLADWMPPAAGGSWVFAQDGDLATVLTGTGFTRRLFNAPEDHRITLGLDLHTAAAAEIHFALPKGIASGRRYVLRITKNGALFGAKDSDKAAFQPLGGSAPYPPASWFESRAPYPEVQVEKVGGWWTARYNGAEAGRIADDGSPKAGEMRLNAEGGAARLDSVSLEALKPAE
jgi:hypothetical protein